MKSAVFYPFWADFYPFWAVFYPVWADFTHFQLFLPILICFYPFCPISMAIKFQLKCILMDFSEITHFKLFLPILSCFHPFSAVFTHWHGQKRRILSKITHFKLYWPIWSCFYPLWLVFTHFKLILPIFSCFYPFCPISMTRKFQKFHLKCNFMNFSEIRKCFP